MDGYIQIRIQGKKANVEISPKNFDISELQKVLGTVDRLLFPNERQSRPLISYEIQEGSVKHIFHTSLQAIIGFNAVLGNIGSTKSIDFLEVTSARAIEELQSTAYKQNYTISISTSVPNTSSLTISPQTNYKRSDEFWVDGEFYLYGEIIDMGGKSKSNIHILVPGHRAFKIETSRDMLREYQTNPLYKPMGVHVSGKQNPLTGEIDPEGLRFIEFIHHDTHSDEAYLDDLIRKATPVWADVDDPDAWIQELRVCYR